MKAGSIATAGSFPQTAAGNQAYHDDQGKFEIWKSSFPWNVEHKTKHKVICSPHTSSFSRILFLCKATPARRRKSTLIN